MRQVTKQSWISLSLLIMRAAANATEPTKPDARAVRDEISTYYADMVCKDGRIVRRLRVPLLAGRRDYDCLAGPGPSKTGGHDDIH